MYPVLFELGRFKLYSFAFFYNVVMVACAWVFALEAERHKWQIPPVPWFLRWVPKSWQGTYFFDGLYSAVIYMLLGLGGAHLLYGVSMTLIQGWGLGMSFYGWVFMLASNLNGSMWMGGFLLCLAYSHYYAKSHKVGYLEFLDTAIFAPIIGQVPGRIACFLGGCCYGKPSHLPWAFPQDSRFSLMEFPRGTPLHPSQLYEATIALLIFIYMWKRRKNNVYLGQNVVRYFVLTGIARFFTEMVRADTPRGVLFEWLTVSQIVGVGLAIAGAVLHFSIMKKKKRAAVAASPA